MKVSCNVIRDILPLYVENMASDDTRRIVEEHTASCESCKKQLDEMSISQNLPVDTDTAPLRKLKAILRKNKIYTAIFTVMLTLAAAIMAVAYLNAPEYIPYSESVVSFEESEDGAVLAIFGDEVSGYQIHCYPADYGTGYVYHITAWDSIWNRYISKNYADNTVLNPDGKMVASVYYYQANLSGNIKYSHSHSDILIYGIDQVPGGGVITLPRLFLAYYAFFAAFLVIICGLAMFLFRSNEKAREIITKLILLPVSYILGHLLIKGFNSPSYSATRDFLAILLVTIPLYFALLLAINLIKEYMRNKDSV